MFDRTRSLFAWLAIAAIGTGCAQASPDDDESVGEATQESNVGNGVQLNGIHFNGTEHNGIHFNGIHFNGIHFNGVQLNNVSLVDTELQGFLPPNNTPMTGDDFVDVKMIGALSNNTELELKIDAVDWDTSLHCDDVDPQDPEYGGYFYTVSYTEDNGNTWQPLCGLDGNNAPVQALFLTKLWNYGDGSRIDNDPTNFTVACRGAALAKCAEWGYRPWCPDTTECDDLNNCHGIPLEDIHQACTRMVRADYCGDGRPHTTNGTSIDIWDNFKIQERDETSTMLLEAEWSQDGAACVAHTRWHYYDSNPDYDYIQTNCQSRWAGPSAGCGDDDEDSTFDTDHGYGTSTAVRALLRNESEENCYDNCSP